MSTRAHSHTEYDEADLIAIRNSGLLREDATEWGGTGMFFARQLDFVKATAYSQDFPAMQSSVLVPDDTEMPEWVETVSLVTYSSVGMAKIIANYADDLPRADVRGLVQSVPIKTLGDSYGYSLPEIATSRQHGLGLDTRKAAAARLAIETKLAKIRLVGDADYGLWGIFTHPNLPEILLPFGGDWGALTGDQCLQNLISMQEAYYTQNVGVHQPDTLALAPRAYSACVTKFLTAGVSPTSPLTYYKELYPDTDVLRINECQNANAGPPQHDVALLYERRIENASHIMPMPFAQLPTETRGLEFVTLCLARSGGVQVYKPLALIFAVTS
jgi:hypothetical protein